MLRLGVQVRQLFPESFLQPSKLFRPSAEARPRAFPGYNISVEFRLRDFRPEDFETLWNIDQKCFAPGIAYSRRELSIYIRRRRAFTVVAESCGGKSEPQDSEIVGFIVAEANSRGIGHVISIDVLPQVRRSGLGSMLLAKAEERLGSDGCRAVMLETAVDNLSALAFYKRHAYHVIKAVPRYYSNETDALVLAKQLRQAKDGTAG